MSTHDWLEEREARVRASKKAGARHLDEVPVYVETMRGVRIRNVHDPLERGIIRTASSSGHAVVYWLDRHSRGKNHIGLEDVEERGVPAGTGMTWLSRHEHDDCVAESGLREMAAAIAQDLGTSARAGAARQMALL